VGKSRPELSHANCGTTHKEPVQGLDFVTRHFRVKRIPCLPFHRFLLGEQGVWRGPPMDMGISRVLALRIPPWGCKGQALDSLLVPGEKSGF
jgi:hypothetical protein